MASAAAATIKHPKLGTVRGKAADDGSGVAQFLGIKYASLKDRFAPPELLKGDPKATVEAGEFGPHVVCLPNAIDMEFGFIQQTLPKPDAPPPTSDVDGLNLNITVPPAGTPKPSEAGFPVLVFVHGGGLFIGANWWPQYDFKRLVKLGVERGVPFIGVNVGYRLGIPGFLTSKEMQQAGYKSNNGLRDQATAFRWVQENIAGFGGDPANVTAMGESAGGASCLLHLQSPTPLFTRLITMSGTPLLMNPLPPAVAENTYAALTAAFGLSNHPPSTRPAALAALPIPDLLAKAPPGLPLIFVHDGDDDSVRHRPTHADLAASLGPEATGGQKTRPWCKQILAGYAPADASILTAMIPTLQREDEGLAEAFMGSFRRGLVQQGGDEAVAEKLFAAYGIQAGSDAKKALRAIVALASDLLFRAGARAYVEKWPAAEEVATGGGEEGKAWLYRLAFPNPWPGPWHGEASHIMDVALVFLNFEEALPGEGYKEAARQWAERVLRFVAGEGPGWDGGAQVGVFGEGGVDAVTREEEVRTDRLARVLREEGVGIDVVVGAWDGFRRGV
ncbi:Carboxylesterase [Lasiodiplodia theobromae]|uniref:Carboxylesterase n=1 Tax=Lasiodiplodia theobromae TaxID=45133 RepID=UPI0015C32494|nr:Carboxylesterase [Lasiodiplodia theobromae]KAF4545741.1 Carboxylesterase [Lasiodiplodia theobromae]